MERRHTIRYGHPPTTGPLRTPPVQTPPMRIFFIIANISFTIIRWCSPPKRGKSWWSLQKDRKILKVITFPQKGFWMGRNTRKERRRGNINTAAFPLNDSSLLQYNKWTFMKWILGLIGISIDHQVTIRSVWYISCFSLNSTTVHTPLLWIRLIYNLTGSAWL